MQKPKELMSFQFLNAIGRVGQM
uniref:Uncharacterized protein n=1 Tax=Rhizophora mucronata TaxID=61149 RepID=A0A2P2PRD0_RHIMU